MGMRWEVEKLAGRNLSIGWCSTAGTHRLHRQLSLNDAGRAVYAGNQLIVKLIRISAAGFHTLSQSLCLIGYVVVIGFAV